MTRPLSRSGSELRSLLAKHESLAVCLDVDGTLAPIARRASDARVPSRTREILRRIHRHRGVTLIIVSGRRAAEARTLVGTPVDWTIGNHGFEVARGRGPARAFAERVSRRAVQRAAARVAAAIMAFDGVVLENKGWTLAVHYRLAGGTAGPQVWRRVREAVKGLDVVLHRGKRLIEVRPAGSWDKGSAVCRLFTEVHGTAWRERTAVICAGDDVTDEHMFARLPRTTMTIKVGRGRTRARYRTVSPGTLEGWLARLERELRRFAPTASTRSR